MYINLPLLRIHKLCLASVCSGNLYTMFFMRHSSIYIIFIHASGGVPKATTLQFYYRLVYYCILRWLWIW